MRLHRLFLTSAVLSFVSFLCLSVSRAQNSNDVYERIKDKPSKTHWCLPEAGNDGANIISGRCKVYAECLEDLNLTERVDQKPYPNLPESQVAQVKKCHQSLYNSARVNPQIKGSSSTQDWLEHHVYPGTEAKPFPIPSFSGLAR